MPAKSSLNKNSNTSTSKANPFESKKINLIPTEKKESTEGNTGNNPGMFIFGERKQNNKKDNLNPGSSIEFKDITTSKTEVFTPTSMFEYMMGIKNISAKSYTYKENEILISKPIKVEGNVVEIELKTTENHPVFDSVSQKASSRQTSIEYYITYKDNPNLNDWIPILPNEEKKVISERLFFNNNNATLRFPANTKSIVVYKNNLRIKEDSFEINSNQNISLISYENDSIYTVDYSPNNNIFSSNTIQMKDYKKEVNKKVEVFNGTAFNKTIELSSYPYIDYEKINNIDEYNPNEDNYSPIKIRLINSSIAGVNKKRLKTVEAFDKSNDKQEAYTFNKSLYKDKSWSEMKNYSINPDNPYSGFDYYQWKNKVVMTETFNSPMITDNNKTNHGKSEIEVSYEYLVGSFRLKAIFRRNTSEENGATPELLNYKIKFKTIK